METQNWILEIEQQIDVRASLSAAFDGLLKQLMELEGMQFKLEPFPGGRWFRDLGNHAGHLWGFVQVIKPPTLLEIQGPMFMSYPVAGHLQIRLSETSGGAQIKLRHRAFGLIEDAHREGVAKGWQRTLEGIRTRVQ